MKLCWRITMGVVAVGAVGAFLFFWHGSRGEQRAVEETRRMLRSQGFKTDLSEFNFFTSVEFQAREAALTNAGSLNLPASREVAQRRSLRQQILPDLMRAVGSDSAIPVWKLDRLAADDGTLYQLRAAGLSGDDLWPVLHELFHDHRQLLDTAGTAALSGPIRFDLDASAGMHMLLPNLAALKTLAQTLGGRAVLELHDGNNDAAWTNLLAATRLITAYEPEAAEVCHLVRFACAAIAYNLTWQLLQAEGWSDERLAQLQREWRSVDFFKGLPETAAFSRASAAAACQLERKQPLGPSGITAKDFIRAPRQSLSGLKYYYRRIRYRHRGSFEDEKALLLYYHDRELDLRGAIRSATWSAMRQLSGVTNYVPFQSKHTHSTTVAMLNTRQVMLNIQRQGQGLLGRAAEAETRRRLIITAIALERYRGHHGSYPKMLEELVPGSFNELPTDFMDDQPLRYRLADDGRFALYSVGLDCVDDGGELRRPAQRGIRYEGAWDFGMPQGTDLVWPRPASPAEIENFQQEQLKAQQELEDRDADIQAAEQWRQTAARQAQAEKILAAKPEVRSVDSTYRGRSLSEVLQNETAIGTNKRTLDELLTLRQVITGSEPEVVTFDVPIAYDILTNLGGLGLYIDPIPIEDSEWGCQAVWLECHRATNGNCLLVWNTIYESPGKHALQMGLELDEPTRRDKGFFLGPPAPFIVSNLCQFSLSSAYFNPAFGATLQAKLPEANGTYTIKITSPAGDLLRTIAGSTTNGVIKVYWDLTDDHGNRCTNNSFGSTFHVLLPESGRSQTQKGP